MAHRMSAGERLRFQQAFALWETIGDGTIDVQDLPMVMQHLGQRLSADLQTLLRLAPDGDRIDFNEFLNLTVGPPWEAGVYYGQEEFLEVCAALDDGKGYVLLGELVSAVDKHAGKLGYELNDDEFADLFCRAVDVSMLENPGDMAQETLWAILQDQVRAVREEKAEQNVAAVAVAAASASQPTGCLPQPLAQQEGLLNLTVMNLSGATLIADAFAPTCSVQGLQEHIERALGLPLQCQALFAAGRALPHGHVALFEAGVEDGMTLTLVVKGELKVDYKEFVEGFKYIYSRSVCGRAGQVLFMPPFRLGSHGACLAFIWTVISTSSSVMRSNCYPKRASWYLNCVF